jgi:hypothetical protein
MARITVATGFGSVGALQFGVATDGLQHFVTSSEGGLVRIRQLIISSTMQLDAAAVTNIQIPITVLRGPSTMQSLAPLPVSSFFPPNAGLGGVLRRTDTPFEILLAKWQQVRNGDASLRFSPNELVARNGDALCVIMDVAWDASGLTPVQIPTTVGQLSVLGDDLSKDDIHQFAIGSSRAGLGKSLPRYQVNY